MTKHKKYQDKGGMSRWSREQLIDRNMHLKTLCDSLVRNNKVLEERLSKQKTEVTEKLKDNTQTTVQNCTFTGVEWDKNTIETVHVVAEGLRNITELFKAQNITIESMLKIGTTDIEEYLKDKQVSALEKEDIIFV